MKTNIVPTLFIVAMMGIAACFARSETAKTNKVPASSVVSETRTTGINISVPWTAFQSNGLPASVQFVRTVQTTVAGQTFIRNKPAQLITLTSDNLSEHIVRNGHDTGLTVQQVVALIAAYIDSKDTQP